MRNASIIATSIIALFLQVSAAIGQDWELLSKDRQLPWAAVGKLIQGRLDSDKICTATLVAPDHILTAAHCVFAARNATPSELRRYTFLAGWNDGAAVASSSIAEIIPSPNYEPGAKNPLELIVNDWALVRLTDPISNIAPLTVTAPPGPWEPVYFLTYSGFNKEAAALSSGCEQKVLAEGPLLINCPVIGGNSGAAVLVGNQENPQIVAVISSKAEGTAVAVIPDDVLLTMIAERL